MTNSIVTITTGKQTFRRSSGALSAHVMKQDGTHLRDLHSKKLSSNGKVFYRNAHTLGIKNFGMYTSQSFTVDDGVLLCLQAQNSKGGAPVSQGMIFLSIRHDGPMHLIDYLPIPDRDSAIQKVEAFAGRADIIPAEDLKDYNVVLTRIHKQNFTDPEEIEELFTINTVDKGEPKPVKKVIKSSLGDDKTVFIRKPRRKMIINR